MAVGATMFQAVPQLPMAAALHPFGSTPPLPAQHHHYLPTLPAIPPPPSSLQTNAPQHYPHGMPLAAAALPQDAPPRAAPLLPKARWMEQKVVQDYVDAATAVPQDAPPPAAPLPSKARWMEKKPVRDYVDATDKTGGDRKVELAGGWKQLIHATSPRHSVLKSAADRQQMFEAALSEEEDDAVPVDEEREEQASRFLGGNPPSPPHTVHSPTKYDFASASTLPRGAPSGVPGSPTSHRQQADDHVSDTSTATDYILRLAADAGVEDELSDASIRSVHDTTTYATSILADLSTQALAAAKKV